MENGGTSTGPSGTGWTPPPSGTGVIIPPGPSGTDWTSPPSGTGNYASDGSIDKSDFAEGWYQFGYLSPNGSVSYGEYFKYLPNLPKDIVDPYGHVTQEQMLTMAGAGILYRVHVDDETLRHPHPVAPSTPVLVTVYTEKDFGVFPLVYSPEYMRSQNYSPTASVGNITFVGCSNSFTQDTLVETDAGEKAISDIQVGDVVLAYNEQSSENEYDTVSIVHIHEDQVIITLDIDGEAITTTPGHPFYLLDFGWLTAEALQVGDLISRADGSVGILRTKYTRYEPHIMYNLSVDNAHTFFVGKKQFLVHNCGEKYPIIPYGLSQKFSKSIQDQVDRAGNEFGGCHICGTRNPGSRDGRWSADHQPPVRVAEEMKLTRVTLYPACQSCQNKQGQAVANLYRYLTTYIRNGVLTQRLQKIRGSADWTMDGE